MTQLDKRKRQEDDLIGVLSLAKSVPAVRQILRKSSVMDKFAVGQRTLQRLATVQVQKMPEINLQQAEDLEPQESIPSASDDSDRVRFVISKFKNNANHQCVKIQKQYVCQQNQNLCEQSEVDMNKNSDQFEFKQSESGVNIEGHSLKSETNWSKINVFIQQGKLKHVLQSQNTDN
eukprot:TRINITY_DN17715_c0_g1_i1.p2 TRINITY_DN17715_c0_g1~~TRINITY_DN17715_c0_g1_i1.p2  ORF type:complete len:176 (-),score=31.69 TRINITY_DN17715_c0_g1_i1:111-638(-)